MRSRFSSAGPLRLAGLIATILLCPAAAPAADEPGPTADAEIAVISHARCAWIEAGIAALAVAGVAAALLLRRRGERAQARLAARLQFLFENAPAPMIVTDMSAQAEWIAQKRREGVSDLAALLAADPGETRRQFERLRVVAINRAALALGGVADLAAVREGLGRFAADFEAAFAAELAAIWEGRAQLTHDIVFHRDDGQVVHAILHWSVPNEDGRPDFTRAMSVFSDVTDLRRTQERLRQSEDRWQLAVQGINAGIWEIDFATGGFFVSARSREMLGYAPGDLADTREAWESLIHAEDRAAFSAAMEQHLARKSDALRVEHRLLCRDGRHRWILARGLAQFDAEGRPVRLVGTHSDIHARKTAEHDLASERERLSVTLRAMAEAVITTNRQGVVDYVNDAAEQLTGWHDGAGLGRPLHEVCPLQHERTSDPVPSPHLRALSEALVVELPASTVAVHRQGVRRLVEGRCAPIRDVSSQPAGVVLVLRDVTERAKLEAEILRATKLESVGVLAGGIAHDFNNLLTVIMGNVTLAMLDTQTQSTGGQWLGEAEKGLLRARDLTQQLLTFAKGGDPIRSAVQLAEVVRETARFSLHGSKVKCQFEIEDDLWAADVDKGQIGQVVQNLVINAAQAMERGGILWINLSNDGAPPLRTGLSGSSVRLSVADTGAGIRPEHLAKIFDPYFTTKKDGSGLGLATVYAVIKKHGGYIEVESEVGRGTRFTIWLPARRNAAAERGSTASPFGAGPLNGRVLLMDDEDAILRMASQLLKRIGFAVETATDGESAIKAYREALEQHRRFDLVIMDLTVPGGMGGLDALRRIKELDPQVRAIVSSGYSSDPVMSDYRSYGFSGMIPKPYRITDFAKVIRQVLEGLAP